MIVEVVLIVLGIVFVALVFQKTRIEEKPGFVLVDDNFARNVKTGEVIDDRIEDWSAKPNSPFVGHSLIALPRETQIVLDFTTPPGTTTGLYYSLCWQLGKWDYIVQKADEWIEVSPVHQTYYQLTQKQKEDLEAKIKAGLTSAAQAVADMELLKHDQRKYREFLDYFGFDYNIETKEFKENKTRDEHAIKAMFIDLVDVHTGDGISMRSIVSRWPTLITDFLKLDDNDKDPENVKKRLDISKAEAVVLVTKNKLYQEWKKLFEPQLKERFLRIEELVKSREESVKSYRDWLRPFIARHKMIEEGLSRPGNIKSIRTSFIPSGGHATSHAKIVIWTWRELTLPDIHKGGTERLAQELGEGKVDCYDNWTKRELIFHPVRGLVVDHPWITDEWCKEQKDWMMRPDVKWIWKEKLYYTFFIITLERVNIRLASGNELEDTVYGVQAILMSQNILFTKLLELKAKQEEMNHYIDGLMGIGPKVVPGKRPEYKQRKYLEPFKRFANFFGLKNMQIFKKGPYERDFEERITKYWCRAMAGLRYGPIVGFIKKKMTMGE